MDLTFLLSAVIFTLLAIVVATSLFTGSSAAADPANTRVRSRRGGDAAAEGSQHNGHVPGKKEEEADRWCDISGSSHDHWDVVKSVQSEEAHPQLYSEDLAAPAEHSSSTPSLTPRPESRNMSPEADSPTEASSGKGRGSFIGLSDKELLKCAFSHRQTEGATGSTDVDDNIESESNDSLRYVPGKARSHHYQMMMSKDELEEEQRVQREQLAAIFQLLKDNKETFGDVSEGDMEEQLRLYSI